MRVRVSDVTAVPGLVSHLVQQGFPASPAGRDEVEVLFPGATVLLEAAAELDLWLSRHAGVTVVALPEAGRR